MFKEHSINEPIDIPKDEVSELFEMIKLQRSKIGFSNDLGQNMHFNILAKISCPAFILHSSNGNTVNIEHAESAHSKINNSLLKVYDNVWGHLLWLGQESNIPIKDTLKFIDND